MFANSNIAVCVAADNWSRTSSIMTSDCNVTLAAAYKCTAHTPQDVGPKPINTPFQARYGQIIDSPFRIPGQHSQVILQ